MSSRSRFDHPAAVRGLADAVNGMSTNEVRYRLRMVERFMDNANNKGEGSAIGNVTPETRRAVYMMELIKRGAL